MADLKAALLCLPAIACLLMMWLLLLTMSEHI
jgi:hypothetical protein